MLGCEAWPQHQTCTLNGSARLELWNFSKGLRARQPLCWCHISNPWPNGLNQQTHKLLIYAGPTFIDESFGSVQVLPPIVGKGSSRWTHKVWKARSFPNKSNGLWLEDQNIAILKPVYLTGSALAQTICVDQEVLTCIWPIKATVWPHVGLNKKLVGSAFVTLSPLVLSNFMH